MEARSPWGNGSAQRDFLYAKDAARAALSIMEKVDGPCNMGSGSVCSIKEIVDLIAKITGMEHAVQWDQSKPNGQEYRSYDLPACKRRAFHRCGLSKKASRDLAVVLP